MLTRSLFALAILSKPWLVCNPQPNPAVTGDTDTDASSGTTGSTGDTTNPTGTDTMAVTTDSMPVCGNGQLEEGEECDDGNMAADDACPNTCKNAFCGDDLVWTGMEQCEDGNEDNTDACVACQDAKCGDGFVWAGMEECDDGNLDDTDGCTSQCKAIVCGDGMVGGAEECDDGNTDDTDACVSCKNATCGDGKTQAGVEECDDGNTDKADGCSEICSHEYLMFVTKSALPADMGGVAGADAACQTAAGLGGLAGTYVASVSAEGDPAPTDLPTGKPLIRTDGMPIVAKAEDLFKGGGTTLMNPVDHDEEGNPVTGYAWTGTNQLGQPTLADCMKWSSKSKSVTTIGDITATGPEWTHDLTVDPSDPLFCDAINHLYCFRKLEP